MGINEVAPYVRKGASAHFLTYNATKMDDKTPAAAQPANLTRVSVGVSPKASRKHLVK